jgi:surfeit locus 1 family protein
VKRLNSFLSVKWVLTTLLVLVAAGVMVRLGFWQLDRLAQRRAFNARFLAQVNAPLIDLNGEWKLDAGLPDRLKGMEYRDVQVVGVYLLQEQLLLRNQVWENLTGYRVLTPLKIEGSSAVILVDRGWIPFDQDHNLSQFDENGTVVVKGKIRNGQTKPGFGGEPDPAYTPGSAPLKAINLVNLERIQQQVNERMFPVYIQEAPDPAWTRLPYRSLAQVEISEGPHLGYAIQWFTFAITLLSGYPFFVRRQLRKPLQTAAGVGEK